MAAMMRPRRRGARKSEPAPEAAGEEQVQAQEQEPAEQPQPEPAPEPTVESPPEPPAPAAAPAAQRFIINLNMLSNADVKFYTEGESRTAAIAAWRTAIGRAKRESPGDAIEVVMGEGGQAVSYILFLAEVTGFAVGPFEEVSDAIPYTVNV